ncbi:TIGR03757 family integrating conjugative element protein, partial [Pseudomonas aeruginosa]
MPLHRSPPAWWPRPLAVGLGL